ncbi:hypothetical protein EXIGLDRAFT_419424 [Exidia glandulosa HHB12029]|uniref:Uncharacterized protein n=1 Tax=Exidia glandulosa HHB12029 TaxID=1314781 RepID=A0A165PV10_EXIGL|nr:hypothetical protein EXIGLDRAFT_419424 [Exidia glandulosa HHB12029]
MPIPAWLQKGDVCGLAVGTRLCSAHVSSQLGPVMCPAPAAAPAMEAPAGYAYLATRTQVQSTDVDSEPRPNLDTPRCESCSNRLVISKSSVRAILAQRCRAAVGPLPACAVRRRLLAVTRLFSRPRETCRQCSVTPN